MTEMSHKERLEVQLLGQQTVESKLHTSLLEHLNAEISLGTITDVSSALNWLKSTYLFCRIKKNPTHYGLPKAPNPALIEKKLKGSASLINDDAYRS
jgi:ATP-dependent DNA helicase HFM1/MER3